MSKRPVLVIYHGGCHDGFCCAWLFSKAFPQAEFHAAQHGTAPPPVKGKSVYIADFSYKRPIMERLILESKGHLTVLDHHQTAEQELAGLDDWTIFDMEKSGGRLTWEFLWDNDLLPRTFAEGYSRSEAPWLVDFTEDRDLWRWQLPDSREINAALRSYPMDFVTWDRLPNIKLGWKSWEAFKDEGRAILRREQQIVDAHVGFAREITLEGYQILAVNATVLTSEIGQVLAQGRPFSATWFDRADGKRVWSLRSEEGGLDVSEIARKRGGGGHRHAAGFEV